MIMARQSKKIKNTCSPRWASFCGWCLKKLGWEGIGGAMPCKKGVVIGVPHTSIWDFLICYLFYCKSGTLAHIMVKKEFFFWPLAPILRALGAVPVDRESPSASVRSIIRTMNECDTFHLALSPEGTRKPVSRWKTGFHMIAQETGADVYLGYFDWGTKRVSVGEKFEMSDNARADMDRIQAIYEKMGLVGKHKNGYITH